MRAINFDVVNAFMSWLCSSVVSGLHPEDAAISASITSFHIVQSAEIYCDLRLLHTAFASHSGESSVNGFIVPVICQSAFISAVAVSVMPDIQLENATAPSVHIHDRFISQEPSQYNAHNQFHVAVSIILHTHEDETMSDNEAVDESSIVTVQEVFTPITAFHVQFNWFSENHTTYHALRGISHPVLQ